MSPAEYSFMDVSRGRNEFVSSLDVFKEPISCKKK